MKNKKNLIRMSVLALGLLSYFAFLKSPSDEQVIRSLEPLIPELEKRGVTAYRNQHWCQVLAIQEKAFANTDKSNCVYLTKLPTTPFTEEARAQLKQISEILSVAKMEILSVENIALSEGRIRFAEFHAACDFCRTRYVFAPGYTVLPQDIPNELLHFAIDSNWYRVEQDWN